MKKFFTFVLLFMLSASCVFALSKPRWNVRPIKVYVSGSPYYVNMMKSAFSQWQKRTTSAVWFTFLSEPKKNEADISVYFVEKNTHCGNVSAIGCTHYRVNNEGFYTHNDIYIAFKAVYQLKGDDGTVATKTVPIPNDQIYRVMLHEIGHAVGINTHSKDPNSIMYKYSLNDVNIPQALTGEDLKFVYNVYR